MSRKPKKDEITFEEVIVTCVNCGRKVKVVKVKGFDINSFLCQKCGFGIEKIDEYK